MISSEKKAKRLNPIIDERKARFDTESVKLAEVVQRKIQTVSLMKGKQKEYMDGVTRLNNERSSANRLMLEALEGGLDTVKQDWISLYAVVLDCEREEQKQFEVMSKAYRDLEVIKHLQSKYHKEAKQFEQRTEQKLHDELALRKFIES